MIYSWWCAYGCLMETDSYHSRCIIIIIIHPSTVIIFYFFIIVYALHLDLASVRASWYSWCVCVEVIWIECMHA